MKTILLFLILNVVVCSAVVFQKCTQYPGSNKTEQVICNFLLFSEGEELSICFKPKSTFQHMKVQGLPNVNYFSSYLRKLITIQHSSLSFDNLSEDELKDLNTYETLGIDKLTPNEWNYLHIKFNNVEPYDDTTEVKVFTYTINRKESQIKIPVHLNKVTGPNYSWRFALYTSTIILNFNGKWEGSKVFTGKYLGRSFAYKKNNRIFRQFFESLQGSAIGYSSNCKGIINLKNPNLPVESLANLPGLIAGYVAASAVGLIFLLGISLIIHIKIKRSYPKEKECDYYEQYPEPYQCIDSSPHLELQSISNQTAKEKNLNNIQEDDSNDEGIYDKPEDTMEGFKVGMKDESGSDTTTG